MHVKRSASNRRNRKRKEMELGTTDRLRHFFVPTDWASHASSLGHVFMQPPVLSTKQFILLTFLARTASLAMIDEEGSEEMSRGDGERKR